MALKNFTQFTPQTVLSATDFVVGYRELDEIRTDLDSLTNAISGLLIIKGFTPGGSLGSVRRVSYRYTIGTSSPVNAVSGVDDFGLSLSYTPGQIEVYRNGAHLAESLDYLATNSTQVRNLSTLNLGDIVEVVALSATGVTVIQTLTGSGTIVQANYRYTVPTSLANGATTVSGPDDFGATLRYASPNVAVFLNGSHLVNSYDYIATTGTSILLNEPVATGDVVDVQTLSSVGTGAVYGLSAFAGVSRIVAQNGVATSSTGGLGVVTLSADIQGRTLKASPVAGDEVMIYDSVAKDNKKTTVATLTSLAGVQQIIQATTTTEINHTSTTYVDVITASIAPKSASSRILVTIHQHAYTGQDTGYGFRIARDSTTLYTAANAGANYGVSLVGGAVNVLIANYVSFQYVDVGPFTANQTYTYKGQANRFFGAGACYSNYNNDRTSIISLMEIS